MLLYWILTSVALCSMTFSRQRAEATKGWSETARPGRKETKGMAMPDANMELQVEFICVWQCDLRLLLLMSCEKKNKRHGWSANSAIIII